MTFATTLLRVAAPCLLAGVAHASPVPAAEPGAPVPSTDYRPATAYRPAASEPASPDLVWREQNRIVAAQDSMMLTIGGGAHGAHGAHGNHGGHAGHAPGAGAAPKAAMSCCGEGGCCCKDGGCCGGTSAGGPQSCAPAMPAPGGAQPAPQQQQHQQHQHHQHGAQP